MITDFNQFINENSLNSLGSLNIIKPKSSNINIDASLILKNALQEKLPSNYYVDVIKRGSEYAALVKPPGNGRAIDIELGSDINVEHVTQLVCSRFPNLAATCTFESNEQSHAEEKPKKNVKTGDGIYYTKRLNLTIDPEGVGPDKTLDNTSEE